MAWKDAEIKDDENNFEGEFWEPEISESIQGVITKPIKQGKYNKLFLTIKDEEGQIWVTSQCASLDKQIKNLQEKEDLDEGDTVYIKYLGQGEQPEDPTYSAPYIYQLKVWRE